MATSGTYAYNADIGEICEEAFERAGLELRTGYDLKTARRSLNLLGMEWANRGLNLWTVEQQTQVLTAADGDYTLPARTIDVIEAVIRTGSGQSQNDRNITRRSMSEYAAIANKNSQGAPSTYYVDRQRDAPVIYLWPIPDSQQTYTLVYHILRQMQDVTAAGGPQLNADIPVRFLPAFIAGLALQIAMKRPEVSDRIPMLQDEYQRQWDLAAAEDRDRSSTRLVPWMR